MKYCRYFLSVLMSLMRGPQIEEPVVVKEELEKVGPMRLLPALPAVTDDQNTQMQAFGLDITKEDNGQYVYCLYHACSITKLQQR